MNLITALTAGVAGCEGGYATVKRRASATNATVYEDFEGENAVASTVSHHALDSNGAVVLYANEVVDVVAHNSAGTPIRQWTEGYSAPAVEYRGQSFTGTDYESAKTGVQYPISLLAVLNKWKDSAGGLDFKVRSNAANTATADLSSIGVGVMSTWYFVTDPVYGAKGDGVTNDLAAIQAAVDAAEAAGGGIVVIGPGTYNINAAIVINSANVMVLGVGWPTIQTTSGSANGFTVSAARTVIDSVRIVVANSVGANNTGYGISIISGGDSSSIRNCRIGESGTYKFADAVRSVDSNSVVVHGGYFIGATNGINFTSTGSDSYCKVVLAERVQGNAGVGLIIEDQSFFSLHGIAEMVGSTADVSVINSDFIDMTTCNVENSGLLLDVNTSHFHESANSIASISSSSSLLGGNHAWGSRPGGVFWGGNVTAAATLTFDPSTVGRATYYTVNAHSANVDTITGTGFPNGYIIQLITQTNTQFNDGTGNLRLPVNFSGTANDVLTLIWDGTNWLQMGAEDN